MQPAIPCLGLSSFGALVMLILSTLCGTGPAFVDPIEEPLPYLETTPTPTATPSAAQTITPGSTTGTLPHGGGLIYLYDGISGEIISLEVRAERPANDAVQEERDARDLLDTVMTLYSPDGTIMAEADDIETGVQTDTQIPEITLPVTGSYRIEIRSWENTGGGVFTLSVKSSLAR